MHVGHLWFVILVFATNRVQPKFMTSLAVTELFFLFNHSVVFNYATRRHDMFFPLQSAEVSKYCDATIVEFGFLQQLNW